MFDLLNNTPGAFSTSSGKKGFSGARMRGDSNLLWIVDGAYLPSQAAGRITLASRAIRLIAEQAHGRLMQ